MDGWMDKWMDESERRVRINQEEAKKKKIPNFPWKNQELPQVKTLEDQFKSIRPGRFISTGSFVSIQSTAMNLKPSSSRFIFEPNEMELASTVMIFAHERMIPKGHC